MIVLSPAFRRRSDVPALGTRRTVGPAHLFEVPPACVIILKLLEEGNHRRHHPTFRSPRRLKTFAVLSCSRQSSVRSLATSTDAGSHALALTFFGKPAIRISPSGGNLPSPAQRFSSVREQPSASQTFPDVKAFPLRMPERRALAASCSARILASWSLVSARSRARHVSTFGLAASRVCLDQSRVPLSGPTSPGKRRSGLTHAMISSLEHERYSAAARAVRKRKSVMATAFNQIPVCHLYAFAIQRLYRPIKVALASVLKLRLKPTRAADVSAVTGSVSSDTANTVKI